MTQRYSFSTPVNGNWKLAADTICEWYHPPYVHGKFINPDVREAEQLVPPIDSYYYDLFGDHMLDSVPGPPLNPKAATRDPGPVARNQKWIFRLFHGGLFGPELTGDIGELPECINPADVTPWGNDQYWLLPNLSLQIWSRNFYITYSYVPVAHDEHIYNIDLWFTPPRNASELMAQELSVETIIEVATQDVNTVEATHRGIATGALKQFHIGDQELMIRNLHHVVNGWVAQYRAERTAKGK
jgi:phenylpropionate dioxygenase-like ring-hydroxylating dioxygenase large terminal subunit